MGSKHHWGLAGASLIALLATTSGGMAAGFGIHAQSATAMGLATAGAGSGSAGLSSVFWNPATVTMNPGRLSEWHASLVFPKSEIQPLPPTPTLAFGPSGNIGKDAIIPTSYASYQWNERLWFGLAATSPFGLVTKPNENWAGQVYSRTSKLFTLNVNPIIGLKVTDWLSIGGGPTIEFARARLRRAVAVTPGAPDVTLQSDDTGVGMTAGATLAPWDGTTLGVGFRSGIRHDFEGTLFSPAAVLPIKSTLRNPETITVGISQRITPDIALHGGVQWDTWSRLGEPAIFGPTGPIGTQPFNWSDGFLYSLGAEYAFSSRWTFRAGVAYERSPVSEATRGTRLPDNDRIWSSIGASFKWTEKLTFDVSYAHIVVRDARVAILPGHQDFAGLPFVADARTRGEFVSLALRYRWDDS